MKKNIEIEQKYRLSSPRKIRGVLKKMGAKMIASGLEVNDLFDRSRELSAQKCVLRLRKHDGREILTFKGPQLKGKYKKRVEVETAIDFKKAGIILEQLGYKKILSYRKTREEFQIGHAHVTLDHLTGIGWFCEIEASPSLIKKLEGSLGLTEKDVEHRTYLDLLGKVR